MVTSRAQALRVSNFRATVAMTTAANLPSCAEPDVLARYNDYFRTQPAALVHAPLTPGTLDLPIAWESVKSLSAVPQKFTLTSPYMLAKTLLDDHYVDLPTLAR